jgi:hypothetical protein
MNDNAHKDGGLAWAGPMLFGAVAVGLAVLFWWFLLA